MNSSLLKLIAAGVLWTGVATAADAPSGRLAYVQRCGQCHGGALEGRSGPALKGIGFQLRWKGNDAALYTEIADKMPPDAVGSIPPAELKAIHTYVIAENAAASAPPPPLPLPAKFPAPPLTVKRATGKGPTQAELTAPAAGTWLMYNRDYASTRASPLAQITPANAKSLVPKCIFQTGDVGPFQASPLVYGERLYVTTGLRTFAMDAGTCKKIWEHEYILPQPISNNMANRGVAIYDGKLFRGTPDSHLIALDAATGDQLWDVWVSDAAKGFRISAAPVVFDGKVIVGEGGADVGATGHIFGFDANTGKLLWTFNMVPTAKEAGFETWGGGNKYGGGSTWSTMSIDPKTRRVYAPIGNPGSSLDGSVRPGDNLFTNSIVVLDVDTGKLQWHVQQVPHDVWDWDTAAAPSLYDVGGVSRMAVSSKDGWLYLYDHKTRKLVARPEIATHFNADKAPTKEGLRFCPGTLGGAEWFGQAFDPTAKLLFVNTVDWCGTLTVKTEPRSPFAGAVKFDPISEAKGWLRAFDAASGEAKWLYKSPSPMVAGIATTAGGVLFTGSLDGEFLTFDAKTGDILYRFNTGGAIAGGVSTYTVGGKQLVAVASGNASKTIWNTTGAATILVFGLP